MKEKKYILQSLEKLNNHLKNPQTNSQIFHYFYTYNLLWQFKSMFFSLEQRDFWKMMFYRALFEEGNFNIAQKIIMHLEKDFSVVIKDIVSLKNEVEALKGQIYSFNDELINPHLDFESLSIKNMVIRINSNGMISYRMISIENQVIEGYINNEYWNDTQILEIYNELFFEPEKRKFIFSLNEFGQLLYIFLPKLIRDFFRSFKIESLQTIPQIYFIMDNMTIPFDLIYDNNFFLLKYSIGYKIGEIPLEGISFEQNEKPLSREIHPKYNVLIIDAINSTSPLKWNEELKRKELIYPFVAGANEINYIINLFNNTPSVDQIATLIGPNSKRDKFLDQLSRDNYHVIIFVGNIFYSKWSPKDSYLLTNDNEIITFKEINKILSQNRSKLKPFLFFNAQIFDTEGQKQRNVLKTFGEVVSQFDQTKFTGIVSRTYPLFNEETKQITSLFFKNLFNNNSQGLSLLKARQQCIADMMEEDLETQYKNSKDKLGAIRIDLRSSLAVSSFLLFGKPWKNLND
jgi:hypothetical protein